MNESWQVVTVVALLFNALLGFGYRLYRLPQRRFARADVNGQALLGVILVALAVALMLGEGWAALARADLRIAVRGGGDADLGASRC